MAEDLPTFNQEIKQIEKAIDNYDFFTIKTAYDKAKLPLNKEYIKAKMLFYDNAVLQGDPPKPVLIKDNPELKQQELLKEAS